MSHELVIQKQKIKYHVNNINCLAVELFSLLCLFVLILEILATQNFWLESFNSLSLGIVLLHVCDL